MSLKRIIEDTDTRAGRIFDLSVQALIIVSLVSFCIETLPSLSREAKFWLRVIEVVTVGLFTIEYGLRILVASRRLGFVFSFYALVDLVAILPFYISAGVDLRAVRIVRLFRVFRVFKFLRYTKAIRRFKDAFIDIGEELVLYFIATALLLFDSATVVL
jgi:voltage-gated potassium channel